ncbi:glycosyl hydrolase family 95 catalytic domain-containing protein [Bogoriella caseilytica]|uniref:Alpha-L-fucosidase 2 n=1 Tax=Bogoriella caseilytica TaxID=56055 RepID=A0A3N2BCB5_9MICO|nr:glycoside hydrolase N-terminal domain-containing protein [Bogoriella caseilytica]ROR72875.1 alpha-L-fucosidase 2 [Bogoriella caseilytica]
MVRTLTWTRPARNWLDGLPLGNGRTGAMVLASAGELRLQLNDGTAWSGSPASEHRRGVITEAEAQSAREQARALLARGEPAAAERALQPLQNHYSQAYLPFADLRIRQRGAGSEVRRSLDLHEAVHTAHLGDVCHETFISAAEQVLVHQVRSERSVDLGLAFSSPLHVSESREDAEELCLLLTLPADVAPSHEPNEPPLRWQAAGVDPLQGAVLARMRHDGEAHRGADGGIELIGVTEVDLVLATETTFTALGRPPEGTAEHAATRARARVTAAQARGPEQMRREHVRTQRALHGGTELRLSESVELVDPDRLEGAPHQDPALVEALFDYGRYLLTASSRPGGLPATLQGLWNEQMQPPWSSAYTLNINVEMNYWAAGPLGLLETAEPLLALTEALARNGQDTARRLYGAGGWTAHHNSDAWAFTSPTGGDASWSHWPMGGAWLTCELGRLLDFGDPGHHWADRLWPLATGAARFVLDLLEEHDGHLVTFPSTSPENRYLTVEGPAALTVGSAMDRALATELFELLGRLAAQLGHQDEPLVAEAAHAAARIRPPVVTADGTIQEWHEDLTAEDRQHRHLSHLAFVYPGVDALTDTGLAAAVRATLDERGDDSTGWSLAWKLALRARLGDGARFGELLRYLFRPVIESAQHAGGLYPNLFAAHPPFQIDANLGFPAAVCEAMLQSHRGEIHLLPALPPVMATGSVRGLVARPGLNVDIDWRDGVPVTVRLTTRETRAAGPHILRFGPTRQRVEVPEAGTLTHHWEAPDDTDTERLTT